MIRPVLAVVMMVVLVGCGVPIETEPREITADAAPVSSRSEPATPRVTASSGPVAEILYFVRAGRLVAVHRPADRMPEPETHLDHLLAGPTDEEHDKGLSSALTGLDITARLHIEGITAVLDLGDQKVFAGHGDEVLAYGQLVCTLTARPDIDLVSFRYGNEPVDVPRGDASLGRQPLTATDYRSLVAPE